MYEHPHAIASTQVRSEEEKMLRQRRTKSTEMYETKKPKKRRGDSRPCKTSAKRVQTRERLSPWRAKRKLRCLFRGARSSNCQIMVSGLIQGDLRWGWETWISLVSGARRALGCPKALYICLEQRHLLCRCEFGKRCAAIADGLKLRLMRGLVAHDQARHRR